MKDYGKLEWVPAGVESATAYMTVGVRFEPNNQESYKKVGAAAYEVRLKNKTVFVVSTSARRFYHMPRVDALLPIPDTPSVMRDLGIDKVLINPHHASTSFQGKPFINAGLDVICDSGGFQLGRGVVDFIDPLDVVGFYNKKATIGVALDVPMHPAHHNKWLLRMAKVQKANTEVMKKNRRDGLKLFNVSHGYTTDLRRKFLDAVYDPSLDGLALGGIGTKNRDDKISAHYDAVTNLLYVIAATPKEKHYHVLGTTSPFFMLVYGLILATGYAKRISCDSVTHYQAQFNGRYNISNYGTFRTDFGREYKPGFGGYMTCTCPICTLVEDPRLLEIRYISLYHNTLYHVRLAETAHRVAIAFVEGNLPFNDMLHAMLGKHTAQYKPLFKYVLDVCEKGIAKVKPPAIPRIKEGLMQSSMSDTMVKTVIERYEAHHGLR